jgi:hypothetical protein
MMGLLINVVKAHSTCKYELSLLVYMKRERRSQQIFIELTVSVFSDKNRCRGQIIWKQFESINYQIGGFYIVDYKFTALESFFAA